MANVAGRPNIVNEVLDKDGKRGLITIIDMTNKEVLKVYGLINLEI